MLLLCVTGLPLIFHHEIRELTLDLVEPKEPESQTPASLDDVVRNGLARVPGQVVQYVSWDDDQPNVVLLTVGDTPNSDPDKSRVVRVDTGTGEFLDEPDLQSGVMPFLYKLHTDMFAGLPGKLFLGAMGILSARRLYPASSSMDLPCESCPSATSASTGSTSSSGWTSTIYWGSF